MHFEKSEVCALEPQIVLDVNSNWCFDESAGCGETTAIQIATPSRLTTSKTLAADFRFVISGSAL
jgi:hypothetical protein